MASRRSTTRGPSKAQREFVSEVEEILERMRADLADLLDARSADQETDPDLLNRLFRGAHSVKGLAGTFGFEALGGLAHRLEDLLDALRMGRLASDAPALELLDEAVALAAALLERGEGETGLDADVAAAELADRIRACLLGPEPHEAGLDGLPLDPSLRRALTEYEEHRLHENLRRGRHVHLVEATFEIANFEEGLSELTHAAREVGEVISTLPAAGSAPESQIRFSLLVASALDTTAFRNRLQMPGASVSCVHEARAPEAARPVAPLEAGAAPASSDPAPPASKGELESLKSISGTVRVDIRKLDELMNLVGELVIQRGAIGDLAGRLALDPATARLASELGNVHKALDRKLQQLQAGVLDVRMVPLRQVFEKLSRVVRRLRRALGKEVRLEVRGADTELDKLIVEELVDPLMHAVRNAFDHAIEPPEERRRAAKPPEGRIRLEAFQRGSHVVIEVADDGRGIDPQAVHTRAVELGLVAADASLTRKQALELIFSPGLSTCREVTETSGRGVGLDVVRANVSALGGIVDVDSAPGRGTTLTFTLPITLAIIQALIVRCGGERFALPLTSVLESLAVEPGSIQRSGGRELLDLRGEPLLLRRLATALSLADAPPETPPYVVVLGLGEARLGLLVDGLEGQQDAVIKPIQGPLRSVRGIAGATELGNRGAVLVLDVAALVEDALGRREAA